ncbi:Protein of unknown function [Gryllus bimaculatus]|nr:Protein of unknown function [Gryllus bimaculatus]
MAALVIEFYGVLPADHLWCLPNKQSGGKVDHQLKQPARRQRKQRYTIRRQQQFIIVSNLSKTALRRSGHSMYVM